MSGWLVLALVYLLALGITWVAHRRGRLWTPWHLDIAMLGVLGLATLGFFWRVVSGENWMPADGGDLVSFLYPTYRFAAATLDAGGWPLWNPHLYGGAPHVGDIQAGFLYPPNLLLFLTRPAFPYAAVQGLSIGHVWFAGTGMYLFLARSMGLRRVAALAGALAFMFSDIFVTHFGNLNFNAVASWLPWVFWAFSGALNSSHHRLVTTLPYGMIAGLLLAVATLAGHIQATLFIVLALVLYTALGLWLSRAERDLGRVARSAIAALGVCFLVAFLLAAPVLLPAFQLAGRTARAGWNYTETAGYSLAPSQWIGWLIPGFFGRGPQFHWGAWPRVEIGYLGILPLILAGLAVAMRRARRVWVLAGLAGVSLVLALGIYAVPHGWLTLLPGFGQLRAPARFVLLTDFALAGLAAMGLDVLLAPLAEQARATFERAWRLVGEATAVTWTVVVPLAYLALLLVQERDSAIVIRISITLIAVVTFAGLLAACWLWLTARRGGWAQPATLGWLAAALIFLDVASLAAYQDLGDRDPSQSFEQPAIGGFLVGQPGPFRIDTRTQIESEWQPNTALLYGLEDVTGVANPLVLADFERYWGGLGSRSTPLYDLLNVRYVVAKKDVTLDWDKFTLAFDGDPALNVYENRNVLPRAVIVPAVQSVPDHEAAWNAIHAAGFDPQALAVVESGQPATGGAGQISDVAWSPNRLSFRIAADGPAFVVLSQIWYPGWQVMIDGRPAGPPLRTNYLFQGAAVPAGEHTVALQFAPPLWRIGWGLLIVGVLLAVAAGFVIRKARLGVAEDSNGD